MILGAAPITETFAAPRSRTQRSISSSTPGTDLERISHEAAARVLASPALAGIGELEVTARSGWDWGLVSRTERTLTQRRSTAEWLAST